MFAAWKILQHDKPDDFCIGSEKQYSVRQFVDKVAKKLEIKLFWRGFGLDEKAYDENGQTVISVDKRYFRPAEVDNLLSDSAKKLKNCLIGIINLR